MIYQAAVCTLSQFQQGGFGRHAHCQSHSIPAVVSSVLSRFIERQLQMDIHDLLVRVEKLETDNKRLFQSNRRVRSAIYAVLLVFSACALATVVTPLGAYPPATRADATFNTVHTRVLLVEDQHNQPRIRLEAPTSTGSGTFDAKVVILDNSGNDLVGLRHQPGYSEIVCQDGTNRVSLNASTVGANALVGDPHHFLGSSVNANGAFQYVTSADLSPLIESMIYNDKPTFWIKQDPAHTKCLLKVDNNGSPSLRLEANMAQVYDASSEHTLEDIIRNAIRPR